MLTAQEEDALGHGIAVGLEGNEPTPDQDYAARLFLSGRSMFLTGKAGTGKSSVTKVILAALKELGKEVLTCGSTGVAALILGGITLHRAMGLGMNTDPDRFNAQESSASTTELLMTIDVLVIDEISMVRADVLDLVNIKLQCARDSSEPFGGVQVLLVGDGLQLPPVVSAPGWIKKDEKANNEWNNDFTRRWSDGYYIRARCWKSLSDQLDEVNLQKVVRQSDDDRLNLDFKKALDKMRYGEVDAQALALLNSRVDTGMSAQQAADLGYLVLAGTNREVDRINKDALAALAGGLRTFHADCVGEVIGKDISEAGFVDELKLKIGAKVMFTRNDAGGGYANGTMGEVAAISYDSIIVHLNSGGLIELSRVICDVEVPVVGIDSETGRSEVKRQVVGQFSQFPLRLCWAITVHRSQGKSIEKCYLKGPNNMSQTGQAYVAVSRAKTLSKLVLSEPLGGHNVKANQTVLRMDRVSSARMAEILSGGGSSAGSAVADRTAVVSFTGWSGAIGQHSTFNYVFGYWAMVREGGQWVASFGSLIHPVAAVGTDHRGWTAAMGLGSERLAMAPSLSGAWKLVERQIDGATLIVDGLDLVEKSCGGNNGGLTINLGTPTRAEDLGFVSASVDPELRCRQMMGLLLAHEGELLARNCAGSTRTDLHSAAGLFPLPQWSTPFLDASRALSLDRCSWAVAACTPAIAGETGVAGSFEEFYSRAVARTAWTAGVRAELMGLAAAGGVKINPPAPSYGGAALVRSGMRVTFSNTPKWKFEKKLEAAGLSLADTAGGFRKRDVDLVVVQDLCSEASAVRKARESGVPIVREGDFAIALARLLPAGR